MFLVIMGSLVLLGGLFGVFWAGLKARFSGSLASAGRYISRGSCDCMVYMMGCVTRVDELIIRDRVCVCVYSPL